MLAGKQIRAEREVNREAPPAPCGWTIQDPPAGYGAERPRLLEQVRLARRARHYSPRTERAYVGWVRRFILFHGKRHPAEMSEAEINAFLTHLAVRERVSASTQNQALAALLFL